MTEEFMGEAPEIHPGAWVHPSAVVIGRVKLGDKVSVWPNAVIRGDVDSVTVGEGSNIQDGAVLHPDQGRPVRLGAGVTVGHCAVVHGSTVGDRCLIGMGAVVMAAEIGDECLVGAGALVTPRTSVPRGQMVLGSPAKAARPLKPEEIAGLSESEKNYALLASMYAGKGEK